MQGLYEQWFTLKDDPDTAFHFYEGDGSNLWPADEEDGYVDYFMFDIYTRNNQTGEWEEVDGGQILTTKLISDMDLEEKLARLDQMVFDLTKDGKPADIIRPDTIVEIDPGNAPGLDM